MTRGLWFTALYWSLFFGLLLWAHWHAGGF